MFRSVRFCANILKIKAPAAVVAPLRCVARPASSNSLVMSTRWYSDSKSTATVELIKRLEAEEKYEVENVESVSLQELAKEIQFDLSHTLGEREVRLTKTIGNELIALRFGVNEPDNYIPDMEDLEDFENATENMPQSEEGFEDADMDSIPNPVQLTVTITKPESPEAGVITCKMACDDTQMDLLSVQITPSQAEIEMGYVGPKMTELDEELHEAIGEYLSARGINFDLGTTIMDLYDEKEQLEYVNWLANFRKFLA